MAVSAPKTVNNRGADKQMREGSLFLTRNRGEISFLGSKDGFQLTLGVELLHQPNKSTSNL